MASFPNDYVERVYAGVLGKLIGVYAGRPFEGWTHQRIMEELGPIHHYVHEHFDRPLVVTDDDVSGTFTFVRALEEHDAARPGIFLSAENIGRSWLNNVIENRSVFWWGGRGISTEHTAYLNLQNGIAAPHSGSIATNGRTVAEQIGAQIFIDAWAMVAPANPKLAVKLAGAAGSVSHDGESVYAAQLWAAMESEAFRSADVSHLLDTALSFIPADSAIALMVANVRAWVASDRSWIMTRQRIEDIYGYDNYEGCCHIMPNHAVMIMALLYASDNFHEALHIINTCGWDTDCNSGNVGCLVALMHGIPAFDAGPDWRGPLADRALISSADGGYSINNAARIALDIAHLGFCLAGKPPPPPPKDGAQFHFTLPGSVQGFRVTDGQATIMQEMDEDGHTGLVIRPDSSSSAPIEVLTQTFSPKEIDDMGPVYPLMASPLVYPGQTVYAIVRTAFVNMCCCLRVKHYGSNDALVTIDGPTVSLTSDAPTQCLQWTLPDDFDGQPIQQLGIALWPSASQGKDRNNIISLDRLGWTGIPHTVFKRPASKSCVFWTRAWVNSTDVFHRFMKSSFHIAKNIGEGQLTIGSREWTDYAITANKFKITYGPRAGLIVRVRGLHRYYGVIFSRCEYGKGWLSLVKVTDEARENLAVLSFDWAVDVEYDVTVTVVKNTLTAHVGNVSIEAIDKAARVWSSGGIGLVVHDGSLSCDAIKVSPVDKV